MNVKPNPKPPKWALRFFRWFCRKELIEAIEGDLMESFNRRIMQVGARRARWHFNAEVIGLLRPGIIRSINTNLNTPYMIGHHLLISWRSIIKNKKNFAGNRMAGVPAAGLATGKEEYEAGSGV